jgi:TRAP-type C4-dicarboxylate transport system permease small subunit
MASAEDNGHGPRTVEWLVPLAWVVCAGWLIWHLSAFTLDWAPPGDQSAFDRLSAQYRRIDFSPGLPGLFGGFADPVDYLALIGVAALAVIGVRTVQPSHMELGDWATMDRVSAFLGRVTMVLNVVLVSVMLYEVMLRYVFEAPTLWANELSLWLAGFLFLLAGLYSMQQRSHISIFIVYDKLPRGLQRACDTFSTLLIVLFAAAIIWGGYGEASQQFYRWETLGTAFDPPIPATLNPAILVVVTLVALQTVSNLIRDWNKVPEHHIADEIDEEEIRAMKKALGETDDV